MAQHEAKQVLIGLYDRLDKLCFEVKERDGVQFVNSFDRAFGFIDDTLIIVNDLRSETATRIEDRDALLELGNSLSLLNDVLEKFGRCQSQVLYLRPLFHGAQEGSVLTQWDDAMNLLRHKQNHVRTLVDEKWKSKMSKMNHDFENLCLGLGDIVAEHQTKINRLYFCSSDEVLTIISMSRTAGLHDMQQFFRRLFCFHYVYCDPDECITRICCEDGEEIPLLKPVPTSSAFHTWMADLESQMKSTIRQKTVEALESFYDIGLRHWAMLRPAQCMLLAVQIEFTRQVETTFKLHTQINCHSEMVQKEFRRILDTVNEMVADVLNWVRCGNKMQRVKLLLATLMRIRKTISTLISENVKERNSIHWLKQPRWYLDMISPGDINDDIEYLDAAPANAEEEPWARIYMQQLQATYDFHGEYTGVLHRTVLGSEAEEVIASVMHAFHTGHMGCVMYPPCYNMNRNLMPAFSPKEFLTELAQMMGKKWQVVQCDSEASHATIARLLTGTFASGMWLIFEDIDLLDPAILGIISEGVTATQSAITSQSPTYQFEGKVVPVTSRTFGVFGLLSGRKMTDVTRHSIELLKKALPPIATPLVPMETVLCVNFYLNGADESSSEMLSRYSASVLERLAYSDLGLDIQNTLKQFLQTLEHIVQILPICEHPMMAVVNSFLKTLLRQISSSKYDTVMDILRACFGATEGMDIPGPDDQLSLVEHTKEELEVYLDSKNLSNGKLFVTKCEQLFEATKCRAAVILKGPPASGKTTIWRTVHEALMPEAVCKLINVSLFTPETLFGKVDVFNEWNDGPFTHIFRKMTVRENEQQWIVLDGKPSPKVLSMIFPILDPSDRCLTLETGEVIRAPANLSIIFEFGTEDEIPKELSDLCWLICTDSDTLSAADYINRHALDPNFFLARYKNLVIEILSNIVPPLMNWAQDTGLVRDWNHDKDPKEKAVAFFPLNCSNLVTSCFNVMNGFKNKRKNTRYSVDVDKGLVEAVVEPIILFSCVWSFGAALAVGQAQRVSFNQFFRNLIIDKGVTARFPMPMGDELGLVFDYLYDVEAREWVRWSSLPVEEKKSPINLTEIFMPVTTSVRLLWMLTHLTDKGINVLVVGPPATAKLSILSKSLRHSTPIYCANTTPRNIETTVGAKLQKSRDNIIRLPDKLNKPLTVLLEGLELAGADCLEFIKQLRDNKGWYDPYSNELLTVHDVAFAATVDSTGLLQFTDRELQGFHCVSIVEPQPDELVEIVEGVLDTWAKKNAFLKSSSLARPLAQALVSSFVDVRRKYRPEMSGKYIWTLASMQSVLQGIYQSTPHLTVHTEDVIRLFVNECNFSFAGRFEPDSKERRWVEQTIWDNVLRSFQDFTQKQIMKQRTELWFGGIENYRDFKSRSIWCTALVEGSEKYMQAIPSEEKKQKQKMLQQLLKEDDTAVLHNLTQLLRVFRVKNGHALLLSETAESNIDEIALAAFLCDAHLFCPQLSAYHTFNDWREVLKQVCITAFISNKPCVVLLEEHNLPEECISDIGALIKHGDVMGLFSPHEWNSIAMAIGKVLDGRGEGYHGKERVREMVRQSLLAALHFIVVKDPEGDMFRRVLERHAPLQTHFTPLTLFRFDRQHLRMCVADVCSKEVGDVVIELYEACKAYLTEGTQCTYNISTTAITCSKMATLSEEVLKDLLSTNEAQKMKYQRCLASVEAFTEENEWARCKVKWREVLTKIEEDSRMCQGNALLLMAVVTWGAGLKNRTTLINRCKKVLRVNRVDFDEEFNPAAIYKDIVMRSDTQEWKEKGVPDSLILPCIAIKCSPNQVVFVRDPHKVAMCCLKASCGNALRILSSPYVESAMQSVTSVMKEACVIVMQDVTSADLEKYWMRSVINDIHNKTVKVVKGFKLLILMREDAIDDRLTANMKCTTSFVSFELDEEKLKATFASIVIAHKYPAPYCDAIKNLSTTLRDAELSLSAVASGAGMPAAKKDAELPDLLKTADDSITEISKLELQTPEISPTPEDVISSNQIASKVVLMIFSMLVFTKLFPTSKFSIKFFEDELRFLLHTTDDPAAILKHFYHKIAMSASLMKHHIQLAWIMIFVRDCPDPQHQMLHMGPHRKDLASSALTNPHTSWMYIDTLASINSINDDLLEKMSSSSWKQYRDWYSSKEYCPWEEPDWHHQLSPFERMNVCKTLRADRLQDCLQRVISSEDGGLGVDIPSQVHCPEKELVQRLEATTPFVPLMVIAERLWFISIVKKVVAGYQVEDEEGNPVSMVRKTYFVGAAHSQKAMAKSLIADAVNDGGWIVISDLMVSDEFARELDYVVETLSDYGTPHKNFKLVIQTQSFFGLPTTLIEKCQKVGISKTTGLGNEIRHGVEMLREYFEQPSSTSKIANPVKLQILARVLPCLIIFHSLVVERQEHGWLAESVESHFSSTDLMESVRSFVLFLMNTHASLVTYPIIRHLTSNTIYGARLSSSCDIAILKDLAEMTIHAGCEGDQYSYGNCFVGNIQHVMCKYAEGLPKGETTNYEILCYSETSVAQHNRATGLKLFKEIPKALPRSRVSLVCHEHDKDLRVLIDDITRMVPGVFDVENAFEWLPEATNPVLKVLYSLLKGELAAHNKIIDTINKDVDRVALAVRKKVPFDEAIVQTCLSVLEREVPEKWMRCARVMTDKGNGNVNNEDYCCNYQFQPASLWQWFVSLREGHRFFTAWSVEGMNPSIVNLESFVNPRAVFDAEVNEYSLSKGIPCSELRLVLNIIPKEIDTRKINYEAAIHVTGIYAKGAAWNANTHQLELTTSTYCTKLPVLYLSCQTMQHGEASLPSFQLYTNFSLVKLIATVSIPAAFSGHDVMLSTRPW